MTSFLNSTVNFLTGFLSFLAAIIISLGIVLWFTRPKPFYMLIWLPTFLASVLSLFLGGGIVWHTGSPIAGRGRAEPSIIDLIIAFSTIAEGAVGVVSVAFGAVLFLLTCIAYPRANALSATYVFLASLVCSLMILVLATVGVYALPRVQPYLSKDFQSVALVQAILEREGEATAETEDPATIRDYLTQIGTFRFLPSLNPIFGLTIRDPSSKTPLETAVLLGPLGSSKSDILERSASGSYRVKSVPQGATYAVVVRSHQGIRPAGIGTGSRPPNAFFEATSAQLRPVSFEHHGARYEGYGERRTHENFVITIVEVNNMLTVAAFGTDEATTQATVGDIVSSYTP